MKLKAALLVFSQAAAGVSNINGANYRQHLCDNTLFAVPPSVGTYANTAFNAQNTYTIIHNYNQYCSTMTSYNQAIEDHKDVLVERHGIELAKTCEQLERNKFSSKESWEHFVSTRKPCPTFSGR